MELDSDTEAVANAGFKLGCISCKMRGEVRATASVDWYFKASDDTDFSPVSTDKMEILLLLLEESLRRSLIPKYEGTSSSRLA